MIQRIQSIFLLLASGSFFSLFGLPFASTDTPSAQLFADGIYEIFDNPLLLGLTAVGGGVALLNIFLFKNRGLQLRLGFLTITCSILLALAAMYLFYQESGMMAEASVPEDELGIFAPVSALIFGILANFFIKKDEKLVRSADRLR